MAIDLKTEIVNLRRGLLAMGAATEQRLDFAVRALLEQDVAAAAAVKAGDNEIDAMEVDLETQCMKVLALGAPVAHDLRFVLSVVRISADFERIADLSRGIAKKVIRWSDSSRPVEVPGALADMAEAAKTMLADVLAALSDEDPELCREVRRADRRVDDLNKEVVAGARQLIQDDVSRTPEGHDHMQIAQRQEGCCVPCARCTREFLCCH
ncbi:MAG: phosphate signaling complex protein PhoU [Phycisphaerales bacterium]